MHQLKKDSIAKINRQLQSQKFRPLTLVSCQLTIAWMCNINIGSYAYVDLFLEYGRHVARSRTDSGRRRAHAPAIHAASHDEHENASFSYFYGCGAPLCGPPGSWSSAISDFTSWILSAFTYLLLLRVKGKRVWVKGIYILHHSVRRRRKYQQKKYLKISVTWLNLLIRQL